MTGYRLEKAFSSRNHNYSAPHKITTSGKRCAFVAS